MREPQLPPLGQYQFPATVLFNRVGLISSAVLAIVAAISLLVVIASLQPGDGSEHSPGARVAVIRVPERGIVRELMVRKGQSVEAGVTALTVEALPSDAEVATPPIRPLLLSAEMAAHMRRAWRDFVALKPLR